jgi:hypothetical protein
VPSERNMIDLIITVEMIIIITTILLLSDVTQTLGALPQMVVPSIYVRR